MTILSNVGSFVPVVMPEGDFSVQWTGLRTDNFEALNSMYKLNRAASVKEALPILRNMKGMLSNIILVDVSILFIPLNVLLTLLNRL